MIRTPKRPEGLGLAKPEDKDSIRLAHELRTAMTSPVRFTHEIVGDRFWSVQEKVAESVRVNRVTTVRSCHGVGKSFMGSRIALWFLNNYKDSIVVTTAPTWRQVEEIMWRQIRSAHKRSKIKLKGRRLKTQLEMDEEWYAIGVSSEDTDKIQGFHPNSGHILVIVDEAAGVSEATYVAAEAIMTSMGARMLMLGNPTSMSGTFHFSHHTDPDAVKFAISCFDTPNFTNNGITNIQELAEVDLDDIEITHPYLITPQWAKDKITRWGVDSPLFQARVLGKFPSAEANTLIPLDVIETATTDERYEELVEKGDLNEPLKLGVDVARYGDDKTVYTPRNGGIVTKQDVRSKEGIDVTIERVKMYTAHAFAGIDQDGLGAGVVDVLQADGIDGVVGIANGSKALADDTGLKFVNLRSQLWWNLAEKFKQGVIYIPPHFTELIAELSSIRYEITRQGIAVETKESLKKRLHKSPDRADSLMYSFADFLAQPSNVSVGRGKAYREMYNRKQR